MSDAPDLTTPAPLPVDILEWLASASATDTMVETLAAGDAQGRLRQAGESIRYLRAANRLLMVDVRALQGELNAVRGIEGR